MTGYLSFSESAYRVIVQGLPICKDFPSKEEALAAAKQHRVTLQPSAWNGDRGQWVIFSTLI